LSEASDVDPFFVWLCLVAVTGKVPAMSGCPRPGCILEEVKQ
jgi:hypothetical protein